jgi:hypothetical protein
MSNDKARMANNPNNEVRRCSGCGAESQSAAVGDLCWRTGSEVSCAGTFQSPPPVSKYLLTAPRRGASNPRTGGGMTRRIKDDPEMAKRLGELIEAWNDYPEDFRTTLMNEWPDLYIAASRVVRYAEVRAR